MNWKAQTACNFQRFCQNWRSFQGHRQSSTL